jgi:hypothetical protein
MNYSSKVFLGDRPYQSYEEYLEDLRIYLILSLRSCLLQTAGAGNGSPDREDDKLREYREILSLLEEILHKKDIDDDQEIRDWYDNIQSRRDITGEMGIVYPIERILRRAGLEDFAVMVLTASLFGTLNRSYQRIFRFLHGDAVAKHPTLELCAKLYYHKENTSEFKINDLIYNSASGLQLLFPELAASDNLRFTELVCDERLAELLLGKEQYFTRGVTVEEYDPRLAPLLYREEELRSLSGFGYGKEAPVFVICGERGAGKKHLVRYFSKKNRLGVVFFDIRSCLSGDGIDIASVLTAARYAAREAMIRDVPLAVTGAEVLKGTEPEQLAGYLNSTVKNAVPAVFLLLNQEHYSSGLEGLYILELKNFTELQRIELWKYYTGDYLLEEGLGLDAIANTFIITPGQIIGAIKQASLLSGGRGRPIREKLLYRACYAQLDHKLSEKTSRVNSDFTWEDLKMPASDKEILRDVCNCVKNRHIVMNEWNFSKIIPYGAGLTILFSGPPGTGKTMAAQVIANELKMELYKIDVSQVFDKYIGETEKNIRQIFELAKKSNSILFFDEADAIFNKRLEAASSNDRFANIESSLLLQCVEEYSGISILATNNFNSIDAAFIRRFKYYILFREPDEAVRYEIWKAVIPKEAPLSADVDLRLLARQFEFTGAVIKNVVISSAYLAAEKGEPISLTDILISIKREMFKNNLILTKEKLGSLGYLFDDIK